MKVTPTKKKFGKYVPGDVFDFPDKAAKVFIKIGKLKPVDESEIWMTRDQVEAQRQTYQTRMMTAETPAPAAVVDPAPYGYKADGTPRKRPGRPVSE